MLGGPSPGLVGELDLICGRFCSVIQVFFDFEPEPDSFCERGAWEEFLGELSGWLCGVEGQC